MQEKMQYCKTLLSCPEMASMPELPSKKNVINTWKINNKVNKIVWNLTAKIFKKNIYTTL